MIRLGWSLVILLTMIGPPLAANDPNKKPSRIALGSFGHEDYGEWFRLLVEDELMTEGFAVVPINDHPEAVLSGIILRQNPADPNGAHYPEGLVRLLMPNGKIAWKYRPSRGMGDHSSPPEARRLVKALELAIASGAVVLDATPGQTERKNQH